MKVELLPGAKAKQEHRKVHQGENKSARMSYQKLSELRRTGLRSKADTRTARDSTRPQFSNQLTSKDKHKNRGTPAPDCEFSHTPSLTHPLRSGTRDQVKPQGAVEQLSSMLSCTDLHCLFSLPVPPAPGPWTQK